MNIRTIYIAWLFVLMGGMALSMEARDGRHSVGRSFGAGLGFGIGAGLLGGPGYYNYGYYDPYWDGYYGWGRPYYGYGYRRYRW